MSDKHNMADEPAEKSDVTMDFDLAFAEASDSSIPADALPAEPDEETEAVTPPDESETEEAPPAPPAEEPQETNPLADKLAQLEQELAKIKETKPPETARAPETTKPAEAAKVPEFELTEEDKAVQAELAADWPTVQKGLELAQRQMLHSVSQLLEEKLSAIVGNLNTTMAPALKTVAEVEGDRFITAVKAAHPDLDTFYPKFEQWINAHPPKLKEMYSGVLNTGTAEEVVALMATYKQAHAVAATAKPTPKAADPVKAKRIEQMRGAKSEASGIVAAEDKDDFYGAFDRAAAR